jgi:hypothetical protein
MQETNEGSVPATVSVPFDLAGTRPDKCKALRVTRAAQLHRNAYLLHRSATKDWATASITLLLLSRLAAQELLPRLSVPHALSCPACM